MNASLLPQVTIGEWLQRATARLAAKNITTARLDALVLLQDLLQHDKSWVLAHPEYKLASSQQIELDKKISLRSQHVPLAYIRGQRDFYNRTFIVTNSVLVPRPETEVLIDQLLQLPKRPGDTLLDVGTGSGVIAITAKCECPSLKVYASDKEAAALKVARKNAALLNAEVRFLKSDLLAGINQTFTFIIANLPYVDRKWATSTETAFEPASALFADDNGLSMIKQLLQQAVTQLQPQGFLLLEADPRQHATILNCATTHGYQPYATQDFGIVLRLQ